MAREKDEGNGNSKNFNIKEFPQDIDLQKITLNLIKRFANSEAEVSKTSEKRSEVLAAELDKLTVQINNTQELVKTLSVQVNNTQKLLEKLMNSHKQVNNEFYIELIVIELAEQKSLFLITNQTELQDLIASKILAKKNKK
jgi:hypothetical protein